MFNSNDYRVDSITIETTIGELICAITDAAREVSIDHSELAKLTELVLSSVLERYQN